MIWLVGMMGSGKTAAGRMAAAQLGVDFADSDEVVEQEAGWAVPELWEMVGEEGFRERERAAIARLVGRPGVVATGGGAVLDADSRRLMSSSGMVLWLDAPPSVLWDRARAAGHRPLLDRGEHAFAELALSREPHYRSVADHRIETSGLAVPQVAKEIVALWRG